MTGIKNRVLTVALAVSLAALSGGCAVLTVDVDVYKGPLANHEDVQMEQMAAMAIGAKPLLVRLRDQIEWRSFLKECREAATLEDWYRVGYVRDPLMDPATSQSEKNDLIATWKKENKDRLEMSMSGIAPNDKWLTRKKCGCEPIFWAGLDRQAFTNPGAQRVNAVLQLYDERHPSRKQEMIQSLIRLQEEHLKAYAAAWARVNLSQADPEHPDAKLWNDLVPHLRRSSAELVREVAVSTLEGNVSIESVRDLTQAYQSFLTAPNALGTRNIEVILAAHVKLRSAMRDEARRNNEALVPALPSVDRALETQIQMAAMSDAPRLFQFIAGNSKYKIITNRALVETHFQVMLSDDAPPKLRQRVADRVTEIGTQYFTARDHLDQAVVALLDLLIAYSDEDLKIEASRRWQGIAGIADLISKIVQPLYLLTATYNADAPESVKADLRNSLIEAIGAELLAKRPWGATDFEQAAGAVNKLLKDDPERVANQILNAHQSYKRSFRDAGGWPAALIQQVEDYLRQGQSDSARRFGIVRGPTTQSNLADASVDASSSWVQLSGRIQDKVTVGSHFERGRLDVGLESLVEDYLKEAHDTPGLGNNGEKQKKFEQLTESLVRFATKLLALANNDSLLAPPERFEGIFGEVMDGGSRLLFGNHQTDRWRDDNPTEQFGPVRGAETYVRVLQAVGNSIIVQADELVHRNAHRSDLRARYEEELAILKHVTTTSAEDYLDNLQREWRLTMARLQEASNQSAAAVAAATAQQTALQAVIDTDPVVINKTARKRLSRIITTHVIARDHLVAFKEYAVNEMTKPLYENLAPTRRDALQFYSNWINQKPQPAELAGHDTSITLAEADTQVKQLIADHADLAASDILNRHKTLTEAIDNMMDYLSRIARDAVEELAKLDAKLTEQAAQHEALINKIAQAREELKRLTVVISESGTKKTGLDDSVMQHRQALDAFQEFEQTQAADTLKEKTAKDAFKSFSDFVGDKGEQKWVAAASLLSQRNPPSAPLDFKALLDGRPGNEKHDARDVVDMLIETLQQERIQAIREGGEDSPLAKNLAASIKAAYAHRASMVYIRPPAAYLRTSYPSTSLQSDPGLQWNNMLGDQALRSIPFAPQIRDLLDPDGKRDAQITAEIDKQFWQNINRVRVAGGGNTNYAIVKDDIGNWYVKGYSANPESIIRSAKNLALAGLGTPAALSKVELTDDDSEPQSVLHKQYRSAQRRYDDAVVTLLRSVRADIDANLLHSKISNAWTQYEPAGDIRADANSALAVAASQRPAGFNFTAIDGLTPETRGGFLRDKIGEYLDYHRTLIHQIAACRSLAEAEQTLADLKAQENAEETALAEAQANVTRIRNVVDALQHLASSLTRRFLGDYIDSHQEAIRDYETRLIFIGETVMVN